MGAVAVVYRDIPSDGEKGIRRGEMKKINVGGREVISVRLLRGGRRYVRRLFDKGNIDSLVVRGDVPSFVTDLAQERGVAVYNGEMLKMKLLPYLISDNMGDKLCCTVYSKCADKRCEDVVRCASAYFRCVCVCTKDNFPEEFARSIMEETGLSLCFGKMDNSFAILSSGTVEGVDVDIDLANDFGIVFEDDNGNFISVATLEAIAGDNALPDNIFNLSLKTHKGLDKTNRLY